MRDTELYRAILGLTPPWTVGSVELDMPEGQVVVRVDAGPGPFACPECGSAAERYDSRPRRWRHLDTCQFTTWIDADVPWGEADPGAVGGAGVAVHGVVRALGD
jgi:transposase